MRRQNSHCASDCNEHLTHHMARRPNPHSGEVGRSHRAAQHLCNRVLLPGDRFTCQNGIRNGLPWQESSHFTVQQRLT